MSSFHRCDSLHKTGFAEYLCSRTFTDRLHSISTHHIWLLFTNPKMFDATGSSVGSHLYLSAEARELDHRSQIRKSRLLAILSPGSVVYRTVISSYALSWAKIFGYPTLMVSINAETSDMTTAILLNELQNHFLSHYRN